MKVDYKGKSSGDEGKDSFDGGVDGMHSLSPRDGTLQVPSHSAIANCCPFYLQISKINLRKTVIQPYAVDFSRFLMVMSKVTFIAFWRTNMSKIETVRVLRRTDSFRFVLSTVKIQQANRIGFELPKPLTLLP